jgi:hypothetical protein
MRKMANKFQTTLSTQTPMRSLLEILSNSKILLNTSELLLEQQMRTNFFWSKVSSKEVVSHL